MHRSRILVALLCAGALLAGVPLSLSPPALARPTPIGQDPIVPGDVYSGDFPDPWIIRLGGQYVAYSTTSDGVNVPTLTSTDLRTWRARPATTDDPSGDGLPTPAAWSGSAGPWAPSVTRLGAHRYVLAYAVQVATAPGTRMCISVATSSSPLGPFVDRTTGPMVCSTAGAIDPQIFVAPNGRPWLVWKRDHYPARIYTRPMNLSATGLLTATRTFLAKVDQPWEGRIIENPAMIRFRKRHYLFYSANSYTTTRYAIGYLICETWRGPCVKPRKRPLLATGGSVAGPGGPAPFVDTLGRLRLGYHAWTVGAVGYPSSDACREAPSGCGQRRLHVARLRVGDKGRLYVASRT